MDLNDSDARIDLLGRQVLVVRSGFPDRVFQVKMLVDEGQSSLHLVRRAKGKKTVSWPLTQPLVDAMESFSSPELEGVSLALRV